MQLCKDILLALILKSVEGTHLAIAFWIPFFWSNLLILTDFQLPLLFLSSRLLSFHSSEPLLPKPPRITRDGLAAPGILGKAKLCALLNWAPPRLKPVVLNVLSKPVSCAVCEGLEGRREDIVENSRDSPHSRSDRLLQAQVWRGFGLRFQMKRGGRNARLGHLKDIIPPTPPPPWVQGDM